MRQEVLRVVLDTNVYISALCFPQDSPPSTALILAIQGKYELCSSTALILEVAKKLEQKFTWEADMVNKVVKLIGRHAKIVSSNKKLRVVEKDPDDNRVLECAMAANAHFIVTGDRHLLEFSTYKDINIIAPTAFINLFKK